jgi:hypothetical protein
MLTKNIYILYPAGYSGSYLNWAINVSDKDLEPNTIKNPVNKSNSTQFGGQGTSHNHVRVPTHQDVYQHLSWVVHNQPTDKKIYIINDHTQGQHVYSSIRYIMQSDPTGVFVIIHNNSDIEIDAYGTINCITKWPTFGEAKLQLLDADPREENFNWHKSSRAYRNFIVKNYSTFFVHMEKLDYNTLSKQVGKATNWYQTRNKLQPHEVNESTYVSNFSLENRIFDISCHDIASDYFPQWLENFMNLGNVSNTYDCKYVSNYHDNYIKAQTNLKWFDSIKEWEDTGKLNSYLTSHCGIEAQVILRIFKNSNKPLVSVKQQSNWIEFYNSVKDLSWPAVANEHDFYTLPEWIQNEILTQHGYKLNVAKASNSTISNLDWENASTEEINQVYQDTKQK